MITYLIGHLISWQASASRNCNNHCNNHYDQGIKFFGFPEPFVSYEMHCSTRKLSSLSLLKTTSPPTQRSLILWS
jgi:hypothetical protein